jgi:hypothetical protein
LDRSLISVIAPREIAGEGQAHRIGNSRRSEEASRCRERSTTRHRAVFNLARRDLLAAQLE